METTLGGRIAGPRKRICLAVVSEKLPSHALMNTHDVIKVGYMQHAAINVGPKIAISQHIISYVYIYIYIYPPHNIQDKPCKVKGLEDFSRFLSGALGKSTKLCLFPSWKVNWERTSLPGPWSISQKKHRSPDSPNIAPSIQIPTKNMELFRNLGSYSQQTHPGFLPSKTVGVLRLLVEFRKIPAPSFSRIPPVGHPSILKG